MYVGKRKNKINEVPKIKNPKNDKIKKVESCSFNKILIYMLCNGQLYSFILNLCKCKYK